MTINKILADVIDETVRALTSLDLTRLQELEEQAAELQRCNVRFEDVGTGLLLAKRHVLELVLRNNESTLEVLDRVSGRSARVQ